MVKFKMTIEVEHPFTLSNDDKDYLRRYAVEAIQTMCGSYHPDDLARLLCDSAVNVSCKELKDG